MSHRLHGDEVRRNHGSPFHVRTEGKYGVGHGNPMGQARRRGQLAEGFSDLCAYTVMYTPDGVVDHYLSRQNYRQLIYEWSNYRFSAGWINSSKKTADNTVLDPLEIVDGWFEIILPSLQMVVTDNVPLHLRQKAEYTLERLHLGDDERVIHQRREWYRMHQAGELTLAGLYKKAPLIAAAIEKQRNGKA
ncbi:MAG: hypothetical protein GY859_13950 [Desulfobacterales bacterium]|nr:hypothetical protein [Desulfobacterales bacterium]